MSDHGFGQSPITYRIRYSLAAQILHTVTERRERKGDDKTRRDPKQPPPKVQRAIEAAQLDLRAEDVNGSDLDLEQATEQALELVRCGTAELVRLGWRWPGRRPPWYVRWARRRGSDQDLRLARFLDRVLEPAAVVLYWSCMVEGGAAPKSVGGTKEEEPDRPLDRRALARAERGGNAEREWLDAYLGQLVAAPGPPAGRVRRLLAWLGIARLRPSLAPSPRVRYNLACLFSRLGERRPDGYLGEASEQLVRCLSEASGPRREAFARWAQADPGMAGLRSLGDDRFTGVADPADGPDR